MNMEIKIDVEKFSLSRYVDMEWVQSTDIKVMPVVLEDGENNVIDNGIIIDSLFMEGLFISGNDLRQIYSILLEYDFDSTTKRLYKKEKKDDTTK